jgi:cellulose synthase/poly-beta-1,6-N-acetylglucosamine synthase-like glycosyltransferase
MNEVTVILSGYKRLYALEQQYEAILNQSIKSDLFFWTNLTENSLQIPQYIIDNCYSVISNSNFGVWGRFAIALNVVTPYVCIIDDDTIPGSRWIENCLNTIKQYNGIITTRGVKMNNNKDKSYPMPESYTAHGWCNPNEDVLQVDMGCHCWFFNKNILRAFWGEMPETIPMNYGEDMHLSYVAQKYFGLGTYVAPHPVDNLDLWGSMPDTAQKYGTDSAAISWNNEANIGMNRYWNFIRNNGYKILGELS